MGQATVASLAQRSLVTLVEYDKDLCVTLQKVLSVDRHRELNFVFFKTGDLSYTPEAVCNTPGLEDFGP